MPDLVQGFVKPLGILKTLAREPRRGLELLPRGRWEAWRAGAEAGEVTSGLTGDL